MGLLQLCKETFNLRVFAVKVYLLLTPKGIGNLQNLNQPFPYCNDQLWPIVNSKDHIKK